MLSPKSLCFNKPNMLIVTFLHSIPNLTATTNFAFLQSLSRKPVDTFNKNPCY